MKAGEDTKPYGVVCFKYCEDRPRARAGPDQLAVPAVGTGDEAAPNKGGSALVSISGGGDGLTGPGESWKTVYLEFRFGTERNNQ